MTYQEWENHLSQWLHSHPAEKKRREAFLAGYTRWEQKMMKRLEHEMKCVFISKSIRVELSAC